MRWWITARDMGFTVRLLKHHRICLPPAPPLSPALALDSSSPIPLSDAHIAGNPRKCIDYEQEQEQDKGYGEE